MAGVAGVASTALLLPFLLAVAALVVSLVGHPAPRRRRIDGAAIGALAVQSLLRIGDLGPVGVSAAVAAVAVLPVLVSGYGHMPRRQRRRLRPGRGRRGRPRRSWRRRRPPPCAVLSVQGRAGQRHRPLGQRGGQRRRGRSRRRRSPTWPTPATTSPRPSDTLGSPLLWPARSLPVVGPHVGALRELSATGEDLTLTAVGDPRRGGLRPPPLRVGPHQPAGGGGGGARPPGDPGRPWWTPRRGPPSLDSPVAGGPPDRPRRRPAGQDRLDPRAGRHRRGGPRPGAGDARARTGPGGTSSSSRPRPRRAAAAASSATSSILDAVDGKVTMAESSRISAMIDARQPGERTLDGLDGVRGPVRRVPAPGLQPGHPLLPALPVRRRRLRPGRRPSRGGARSTPWSA